MSSNSIKYTIFIKNNISGDIVVLQEAYAVSLSGPLKPDFRKRANKLFSFANVTRKWNVTISDCDVQIYDGEWVGEPNISL
ncbi:hypothetical protein AA106555_1792 [Neokomagataea thailandica NBRC 106555]|uniref:Uncharacterized protein n=1 Tax=Neokomagataea thailandica NBRC 106555 TaxID=1223520 RepID=A0ABQ0QS08_9PROT|nr:hypothetical protein [Neokomagataea thailandica]GBR54723.1 hypothetical protein AA106555_1792 [Neokomagataea thailandica NBRC 106555]